MISSEVFCSKAHVPEFSPLSALENEGNVALEIFLQVDNMEMFKPRHLCRVHDAKISIKAKEFIC
jgi:hypothetical protein